MAPVRYRFRGELRARWRSASALALLAVGRWAWTALADNLGTVAEPIIPILAVLAIPVVLLIADAVSYVPCRIAARLRPATLLRSE